MFHIPAHKNVQHPAGQINLAAHYAKVEAQINYQPGDRVVHVPTGSIATVVHAGFDNVFCNFGSKANPSTWVKRDELLPEFVAPPVKPVRPREIYGSSQYNDRDCLVIMSCRMGHADAGYCLDAPRMLLCGSTWGGELYVHDTVLYRDFM